MKIVWIAYHIEGLGAFRAVLESGYDVRAMYTLTPDAARRRSAVADYAPLCQRYGVPLHLIDDINDRAVVRSIAETRPDLLIALGWSQMLAPALLDVPRLGTVGAHASMLPKHRGRAPVNWAIIRGEAETGNTLLWLSEGVDRGDIIDQVAIPISAFDTCATIYDEVARSNHYMLLDLLKKLARGQRPGISQRADRSPALPARTPADGLIDWTAPARSVYDLVRGVTRPYPGAFSYLRRVRWTIWSSALLALAPADVSPGQVIGASVSPEDRACGQIVGCGEGAVILLEVEDDQGRVLSGRDLAAQPWSGEVWTDG